MFQMVVTRSRNNVEKSILLYNEVKSLLYFLSVTGAYSTEVPIMRLSDDESTVLRRNTVV